MTDEKSESEITAADVNPGEDREVADGRAAPHYDPLPPKSKRKKKNKPPVGVGGLLDYARIKFARGVFGVEEDNNGQYKIGGEDLSFEMWGQMIHTRKEEGVCVAQVEIPKQKIRAPQLIYDVETTKSNGRASKRKKPGKGDGDKKEKDEGELSDSAESDSSSSSDSDQEDYSHRKNIRKFRATTDSMDGKEIFTKAYQYRNTIIQNLNLQQKMTLFELLKQQMSSGT